MKHLLKILLIALTLNAYSQKHDRAQQEEDLTQFVNPFIGTSGTGHTFPGATTPMGMVQLSPHTGNFTWDYHTGYQYRDSTIRGFAHTHLNGGANPVLGDVLMLPFSNEDALESRIVPFSKEQEKASPGYYATYLHQDHISVELAATARTGIQRYTFQNEGTYHILINLDEVLYRYNPEVPKVKEAFFTIENDTIISGYQRSYVKRVDRKIFFVIYLNKPPQRSHFVDAPVNRQLVLDYPVTAKESVEARVAISTVSIASAKRNLEAESLRTSFEEIRENAVAQWNKYLSKVAIEGTAEQKQLFYTNMYHLFIQPNNMADVDGRYRGTDDKIYRAPAGGMYSTFAFWDIYRAAYPLYTLLIPDKIGAFVASILRHYDEQGYLPAWPMLGHDTRVMIGNHSVPVIVDAYLKGLAQRDEQKAFEAIKATLTQNHNLWNKYDWTLYDQYGYLPSDTVEAEAVSRTLEATFDDWSAAQLAKELGREEDFRFFQQRSNYYQNLFDPETKLMRGKNTDGQWVTPFDPLKISHAGTSKGDYTEANAFQYTWHVQHDIEGLIELMGGRKSFAARLDSLFSMDPVIMGDGATHDVSGLIGQYAHGNEPSQHIAYLYNYADQPHKTQARVREILQTMYNTSPEGYIGNNDFGQMSAWYILSSLGFYPVNPVSGQFDIGTPAYAYAYIDVGDKPFEIRAIDLTLENKYVKAMTLNGQPLTTYQLSYDDIMRGGKLVFEMTSSPTQTAQ